MPLLRCPPEIVSEMLFRAASRPVRITGCSFDQSRREIHFEIEGDDVPTAPEVEAIFLQQREMLTFRPREVKANG